MPNMRIFDAIHYCLRPLVQVCLRHEIDHHRLSEMLKTTFVSAAEKAITARGDTPTDSQIASMTGVPDDEVRQLRTHGQAPRPMPDIHSLAARLVSHWIGTPGLLDEWGQPRPLKLQSTGDGISFEDVAREVTGDRDARDLLDECLRQGVISAGPNDEVRLKVDAMIPHADLDQKATFFAHAVHDHIAAAGHNLSGGTPPFLDRYVWHTQMTEAAAAHVSAMAEMAAMQALKDINQQVLDYDASAAIAGDDAPRNVRIHFGTYFYSAVHQPDESMPEAG